MNGIFQMNNQPHVYTDRGITEPASNSKVWRYIDYHKLLDMLKNSMIPLVSPRLFPDKLEGAYSNSNLESTISRIKGNVNQAEIEFHNMHHTHEDAHGFAKNIYVSCWNLSEIENMLMWECYSNLENGIAIVTTYEKLKSLFNENFFIGNIKYYTHELELPLNTIERHFYKGKPYQGEQEVRVIYHDGYNTPEDFDINNGIFKFRIEPKELFEMIITSPNASEAFIEDVNALAAAYNIEVQQSQLGKQAIPKKMKSLLLRFQQVLKVHSNSSCAKCQGNGWVMKANIMIFCETCQIKQKWESIKSDLFK